MAAFHSSLYHQGVLLVPFHRRKSRPRGEVTEVQGYAAHEWCRWHLNPNCQPRLFPLTLVLPCVGGTHAGCRELRLRLRQT